MTGFVGAALTVLAILIAFIILLLLILVADNKMEPPFPCVECKQYNGERECQACVDGVDGEPIRCVNVRGSLRCRRHAGRR